MSLKTAIVNSLIETEITQLETQLEAITEKAENAEPKLAAEIQLEVAKAKAIFAKYKSNAASAVAMVKAEIVAAEQMVVAEVIRLEAKAKAIAEAEAAAVKAEVVQIETKVKKVAKTIKAKLPAKKK